MTAVNHRARGRSLVVVVVEISADDSCQSQGEGAESPALVFCSAVVSTVDAFQARPDHSLSVACVRAALTENRIDLLTHWLSQRRYDSAPTRSLSNILQTMMFT